MSLTRTLDPHRPATTRIRLDEVRDTDIIVTGDRDQHRHRIDHLGRTPDHRVRLTVGTAVTAGPGDLTVRIEVRNHDPR